MNENKLIRNREHMKQIKDFSGMIFIRGIRPTDIDGFMESKGKNFVFFELKYKDHEMGIGQEMAFENLCDIIGRGGGKCVFIIAKHEQEISLDDVCPSCGEKFPKKATGDIDVAKCEVVKFRYKGKWRPRKNKQTLKEFIDSYVRTEGF